MDQKTCFLNPGRNSENLVEINKKLLVTLIVCVLYGNAKMSFYVFCILLFSYLYVFNYFISLYYNITF